MSREASASSSRAPAKKVRCALLLGYLGTAYEGSQYNARLKTIEGELLRALSEIGLLWQNATPAQTRLSRSSRTDKGVHAAAALFALDLRIPRDALEPPGAAAASGPTAGAAAGAGGCAGPGAGDAAAIGRVAARALLERLNGALPEDIRAFDLQRVRSGFDARDETSYRLYEYLLPAGAFALRAPPEPEEDAAADALFAEALEAAAGGRAGPDAYAGEADVGRAGRLAALFLGTRHFHNYAASDARRKRRRTLAARDGPPAAAKRPMEGEAAEGGGEGEEAAEGGAKVDGADAGAGRSGAGPGTRHSLRGAMEAGRWPGEGDALDPAFLRTVYRFDCEAAEVAGRPHVLLRLGGRAFLLHQIRKMVGTLVACCAGYIPEEIVRASLDTPLLINGPMAPGYPLALAHSVFAAGAVEGRGGAGAAFEASAEGRAAAAAFLRDRLRPHVAALLRADAHAAATGGASELGKWLARLARVRERQPPASEGGAGGAGLPPDFLVALCGALRMEPDAEAAALVRAAEAAVRAEELEGGREPAYYLDWCRRRRAPAAPPGPGPGPRPLAESGEACKRS
eukprot:tig00000383_g24710.t1